MKTSNFERTVRWKEYLGIDSAATQYGQPSPHLISTTSTTAPEWQSLLIIIQAEQTPASGKTLPDNSGLRTFSVNLVTEPNSLKA